MKKILLLLIPMVLNAQNPPPPTTTIKPNQQLGSATNNQGFTQSKSFKPMQGPKQKSDGGSKVRANPFLSTADFAFIGNPSFEGGYRSGLSLGTSRTNMSGNTGYGTNALFTTDLTQRGITAFTSRISNKSSIYFAASWAQIGKNETKGVSVTREYSKATWNYGVVANATIANGEAFRIFSPTVSTFINKQVVLGRITVSPEVFMNFSNNYYDRDAKLWDSDFTVNALAGTEASLQLSKRFVLNFDWRANINTNPKWGVMYNFLVGSNFKF
jgi:hypothetical protein